MTLMEQDERAEAVEEQRRGEIIEIGKAVKLVRNGRGWSLRRLAEEAGVSASLLSAIETGKIVPTVGSLFAISDALGQPAEQFFPHRRRPVTGESQTGSESVPAVSPARAPASGSPEQPDEPGDGASSVDRSLPASAPTAKEPPPVRSATAADPDLSSDTADRTSRSVRRPGVRRPVRLVNRPVGRQFVPRAEPTTSVVPAHATGRSFGSQSGAPSFPAVPSEGPGVEVRRALDRPTMALEDGTIWSVPFTVPSPDGQVIEVLVPPTASPPPHHRIRESPVVIMVLSGRLDVEAAFSKISLQVGDGATISAGVPYRLVRHGDVEVRYLVILSGPWEGRL